MGAACATVPGSAQRLWRGAQDGPYPYPGVLAWSDRLLVSPDSVNMLSEAAATRAPVFAWSADATTGRLRVFVDALRASGRVRDGDDDFAGLRAHRAADSPRHVAWKALARGGPMLTKQYAAAQGGDVLLDWSALPTHLDEEQRLSRLTAWVLRADQDGRRYGLLLPQTHIAPGLGRDHRDRCLRELALFGIAPEDRA